MDITFHAKLQMVFANQPLKLLSLLFGLAMIFALSSHYKTLLDERQKLKTNIGMKEIFLYIHHIQQNLMQHLALKVQHSLMYMLHTYTKPKQA